MAGILQESTFDGANEWLTRDSLRWFPKTMRLIKEGVTMSIWSSSKNGRLCC
jgi:hypothetical protein